MREVVEESVADPLVDRVGEAVHEEVERGPVEAERERGLGRRGQSGGCTALLAVGPCGERGEAEGERERGERDREAGEGEAVRHGGSPGAGNAGKPTTRT
jgi:hypothetical protein